MSYFIKCWKVVVINNERCKIIDSHGDIFWYKNSEFHREDGPAVQFRSPCFDMWFLNGIHYSEKEYYEKLKELK
jgi:hypothetical protein